MIADRYETRDDQGRTVRLSCGQTRVSVVIDDVEVVVERTAGENSRPGIPLGTRVAAEVELRLNGSTRPLTIGAGRLSRRSYRVMFEQAGITYTFVPVGDVENVLRRGRTELARYLVDENGRVETWQTGDDTPAALESAAGFALAAAFGCGARHGLDAAIDVVTGGTGGA